MRPNVELHVPTATRIDHEFRFETFFIGQLVNATAIEPRANIDARFRLLVTAIHKGERAGYYVDGNQEDYDAVRPARRCNNIDAIMADARILVMDGLFANGHLDEQSWAQWRDVGMKFDLNACAPTLLAHVSKRHKTLDSARAVDILNHCFLATAPQVPGMEIEQIRRERPRDPVALVAATPLGANAARSLARETVFMAKLHHEGLLTDDQIEAIYDASYRRITGYRGTTDLSNDGGSVIINALTNLQGKQRAELWHDAVRRVGSVAVLGADTPFAACAKPNPPKYCGLVQRYPVAAAFTTALIQHKQLDKARATDAWEKIGAVLPD